MPVNSSFADDHTPPLSSNSSLHLFQCFTYRFHFIMFAAFSVANVLLLPLFVLVFYLGFQRWRLRRSGSASHSDLFTYHMVAMEIIAVIGCFLCCVGLYFDILGLATSGYVCFSATWCVKIHFHVLTCVERYLAVVHPITYMSLRNKGGVRIRNISIGCVWLLYCLFGFFDSPNPGETFAFLLVVYLCSLGFALSVISFCSLSVLHTLRHPGPGEVGGRDREWVDQSKKRAFHTVVTILGVLLLCTGGMMICEVVYVSPLLTEVDGCIVLGLVVWFTLPSNLVLPLLFLHRAEKLPCCRRNTESGT